jgi:GTP-binding protein
MVRLSGERSFVVADIPGLIEGAHTGAGLGARFLRHLERTRVLIHLLDASAAAGDPDERAPLRDFDAINKELSLFDPELAKRPQIVVLNKLDLPDVKDALKKLTASFARRKVRLHAISAATGAGIEGLLEEAWKVISAERRKLSTASAHERIVQEDSSQETDRPKELTPRARPTRSASTTHKAPGKTTNTGGRGRPAKIDPSSRS